MVRCLGCRILSTRCDCNIHLQVHIKTQNHILSAFVRQCFWCRYPAVPYLPPTNIDVKRCLSASFGQWSHSLSHQHPPYRLPSAFALSSTFIASCLALSPHGASHTTVTEVPVALPQKRPACCGPPQLPIIASTCIYRQALTTRTPRSAPPCANQRGLEALDRTPTLSLFDVPAALARFIQGSGKGAQRAERLSHHLHMFLA